jgi:hypothetical protein
MLEFVVADRPSEVNGIDVRELDGVFLLDLDSRPLARLKAE